MDSPVIECLVSGRQRISLNRASLRRKRSMRAATKTTAASAVHADKGKPRAQKAKSTVLQECVRTYFASLNSISRSIVLESEALQQLCPDWENLNARQQEEILNKHFVPSSVAEHYSNGDRRSMSPFSDAEPEIDVMPRPSRSSAKKESIAKAEDEACFSPKGKSASDVTQMPAAVTRRKEKELPFRAKVLNALTSDDDDDDEGIDTPIDRMDPVRRSFRVSSRQLADSRNRSMSMRVSRARQQHHINRSLASIRKQQSETSVTPVSPSHGNAIQKPSQPLKPRAYIQQQPTEDPAQQTPKHHPIPPTGQSNVIPMSRTSSACSSVSSVSVPGFGGGRVQKYSLQRPRHHSSQALALSNEQNNGAQLTGYSRRLETAPRLHHVSALSLSNGRSVRFEDDDRASSLSQSYDLSSDRKFVPVNQRRQESGSYSPRRSRANSQSPARMLDRDLSLRTRTRSQSPGRTLDESPQWSHSRSQSPGNYLNVSSSHLPSDTEYYADSDIASQRSVTPESILEADGIPGSRPPSEKKFVTGIQRSYSALKNRAGSTITTTTSSFANPRKNIRRSLPRRSQHRVSDAISEVGSNSYYASQELSLSYSQSQDTRTLTPLDVTDRLNTSFINIPDARHSKTESDVGYMSAGADELDVDVKSSSELMSNRESGYLSCCDSIAVEQHTITKEGEH